MNDTATETVQTKKPSKAERLAAAVEGAKAHVAALEAELGPKISAERAKLDSLRKEMDRASKASTKSFQEQEQVRRDAHARIFPGEKVAKLNEQVKAFVAQKGFSNADADRLAREYMDRAVAADPEVVTAVQTHDADYRRARKASTAWNVASSPATALAKMEYRLEQAKDQLCKLGRELERLPSRNQAARDARRDQKLEEKRDAETQGARAVMSEFVFTAVA